MDTTWVLTGVVGILLIYMLYKRVFSKQSYWKNRGVAEIKSSLFETLRLLILSKKTFAEYVIDIYEKYKQERYVGYILQDPVLMVNDPDLITDILIKDFSYFEDRLKPLTTSNEFINLGLASLSGNRWRLFRHKLTPTFTTGKMKSMFDQIKQCSENFNLFVKENVGEDMETRDFLFKFMMNVIGSTAFSIDVDALNKANDKNDFLTNSQKFFKPNFKQQMKFVLATIMPKVFEFFKVTFLDDQISKYFLNLTKSLIAQRKNSGKKRNDFLQLLLDLKDKELAIMNNAATNKDSNDVEETELEDREMFEYLKNLKFAKDSTVFTDESIAAQTFTFVSGGSETTSTTLSFALHELAVNIEVQQKLQQEIDSLIETYGFTYETVKKMKYLEQVLYETLRLRNSGVITRLCNQDYKISGFDLILEKNTLIQIPSVAIHRDSQYFPDPLLFNPDRFTDMDSIRKGVFFPFGGGPRMCIAMRLAMLEMKVFLATVLSVYNVLRSNKTPVPLVMDKKSIMQHVKGGLWVKFEARNNVQKK